MNENIKNLFQYLREIYQLRTKVVNDFTKYEKYINIQDFQKQYSGIAGIHNFTDKEEYFVLKYVTNEMDFPEIPEEIKEYIDISENGPALNQDADVNDEIKDAFKRYKNEYDNVQKTNENIRKYNALYEYFYDVLKRKEELEEKIEVLLCKGFFMYKHKEHDVSTIVKRHVIEIPLIIEINHTSNTILLKIDRDSKLNIEYNFVSSIPGFKIKDQVELLKFKADIEEKYSNNETIEYEKVCQEYLNLISFKNEYVSEESYTSIDEEKCYIVNRDDIIVRKKQPTIWFEDLNSIVQLIENGEFAPENVIPELILEDDNKRIKELLSSTEDEERVLFPLLSNEEQYKVVEQAKNSNLVLVQGPPGTGKSHTIANLISNYIAQGKRILVTSEKYKALEVIREKLPSEIRDLSMTVFNQTGNSDDIALSIQKVLDRYKDKEFLYEYKDRIDKLETKLSDCYDRKAENQKEILNIFVNNTSDYSEQVRKITSVELDSYMLSDIARFLFENKDRDYISDINNIKDSEFNKDFLVELDSFANVLKPYKDVIVDKEYDFPENLDLDKIEENINDVIKTDEKIAVFDSVNANLKLLKEYDIDMILQTIEKIIKLEEVLSRKFIVDNCKYEPRIKSVNKLSAELETNKEFFKKAEGDLLDYEIEYDKDQTDLLLSSLDAVNSKLIDDRRISLIEKIQVHKELDNISNIKINGRKLTDKVITVENLLIVTDRLRYYKNIENVKKTVSKLFGDTKMIEKINEEEFSKSVDELREMLNCFVEYPIYVENLELAIKDIFSKDENIINLVNEKDYINLRNFIKDAIKYKNYQNNLDDYNNEVTKLKQITVRSHVVFEKIIQAINNKDIETFKKEKPIINTLYKLESKYNELKKKYNYETENYTSFIKDFVGYSDDERSNVLNNFNKILEYYKLKMLFYFEELKNKRFGELFEKRETLSKEEKRIIIDLISEKSWYNQINDMDDLTCKSLSQWLTLKTRLGKGKGKRANKIRREMQEQMQKAKAAIPIWIMPVDKVIEQYPYSNTPQFDVLIMDESSQSSIISLSVLLRGRKNIIVGDDKQISPISIGITIEDLNSLYTKYLKNTSLSSTFDMETSIYDMAQNMCGSRKVVLKEHFRCLPEIIEFSNLNFYGNQINCLKVRGNENTIKEPIKTIYLPNAKVKKIGATIVNQSEIDEVVTVLKMIEKNEDYNKKNIGIIVLQNSTPHLNLIVSSVWKNFSPEFIKSRDIKIGTTYDFQGDERDVIILSMVTSKVLENGEENRIMALTKDEYKRSFNVAASRAKEQVILIHSVSPEELSSECLRYKLIMYYNNYNSEKEKSKERLFESLFEKDFYKMMQSKGIILEPQFKVGKYRIDFIVENDDDKKIAIECDGDKYHTLDDYENDIIRQEILERCGWRFIRIRASQYYYDQENAVNEVCKKIQEYLEDDNKIPPLINKELLNTKSVKEIKEEIKDTEISEKMDDIAKVINMTNLYKNDSNQE